MRRLRTPAAPLALVAALVAVIGLSTAAAADTPSATSTTTTPPPSSPPAGATRLGEIAAGTTAQRISADGDVAAWTATGGDEPAIWVATAGQVRRFPAASEPLGVTVGHVDGQPPVVLFSLCPPGKHMSKARRGSCDLYRLSSLDASGSVVPLTTLGGATNVRGASTKTGDERTPAVAGHFLVFARWRKGPAAAEIVRRDVNTGHETLLPGGPLGTCRKHRNCSWDQDGAAGPIELAASGSSYAEMWVARTADISLDPTSEVHVGSLTGRPHDHTTTSTYVDGDGNEDDMSSLQVIGDVTQVVDSLDESGEDSPPAAPGAHDGMYRVQRRNNEASYIDPAGRRIVAAATTQSMAWLILDASALPGDLYDASKPRLCAATVGGCVVEQMPLPQFTPLRH